MARTRRTNVLSLASIREMVSKKCVEKKIALAEDVRDAVIEAVFSSIRGSLKSTNRKDGDFIDIPGLVRIYVEEDDEKVVRIPRTGAYLAKGKSRSLKFKILKPMKEQLEAKFAKKPGQKTKDAAEAKNVEHGVASPAAAAEAPKPAAPAAKAGKPAEKKAEMKPAAKTSLKPAEKK